MKPQGTDMERMIMQAHYLEALEIESRADKPLADMERQEYIDTIVSLRTMVDGFRSTIDGLHSTINDLNAEICQLRKSVEAKDGQIAELVRLVAETRSDASKHRGRTLSLNQDRFSTTSKKSRPLKAGGTEKTRQQEKEETDTKDDLDGGAPSATPRAIDEDKVEKTDVTKERGPRGPYTLMDCAQVEVLESLRPELPDGWKIVGTKDVDEYTRVSYIKGTRFIVYVVEDHEGVRHDMYIPADASDSRAPHKETIAGTHATPELVASLAVDRFQMHVPVSRQMIRLCNEKMTVCEQTVSNWLSRAAVMLERLMPLLRGRLLRKRDVLHIDETWCRIKIPLPGHPNGVYKKKYIWCLVNKLSKVTYFLYDNDEGDSRGQRPIRTFLGDFVGGIQTDAYNGYKFFCGDDASNTHAFCWAHVRTRFWNVAKSFGDKLAEWFVEKIGYLYLVETECRLARMSAGQTARRRQMKDVKDTMEQIRCKAEHLLTSSAGHLSDMMERALKYMIGGWEKLQTYLSDGRYDIDNLEAERRIRPFTLGRKNSVSFGGEAGAKTATVFYTIIETCRMWGISPLDYITYTLRQMRDGNTDYESLLPSNYAMIKA